MLYIKQEFAAHSVIPPFIIVINVVHAALQSLLQVILILISLLCSLAQLGK